MILKNRAGYRIYGAVDRISNLSNYFKLIEINKKKRTSGRGQWIAYVVSQMDQDTITTLHMMRLQPSNQRPDQQPELGSIESARGILGVNEEWALVFVGSGAAEREGQ